MKTKIRAEACDGEFDGLLRLLLFCWLKLIVDMKQSR